MENEVIERFKMHDRMEVVSFLKSMWNENRIFTNKELIYEVEGVRVTYAE